MRDYTVCPGTGHGAGSMAVTLSCRVSFQICAKEVSRKKEGREEYYAALSAFPPHHQSRVHGELENLRR
ncbi:hypothetical protein P152DRAFT_27330 [Eremomyces bilateralis CBS 781.70]|uniref:Uncharacterized protein n=1 Tax=Eremomyces bilateralis CBS 781.70 TaxID=1392243 RepID=A0A6G1G232_9PEZI|nr:uncharacterized protein P152DRAFT_27330 [Eremomyces bilateralis CBS 781.70]KAF1812167.1 hypothetical protein P152DRAFT_27330 [Eremomyces bilateralis CBS 781.70]